jgi:hypothetical protein
MNIIISTGVDTVGLDIAVISLKDLGDPERFALSIILIGIKRKN